MRATDGAREADGRRDAGLVLDAWHHEESAQRLIGRSESDAALDCDLLFRAIAIDLAGGDDLQPTALVECGLISGIGVDEEGAIGGKQQEARAIALLPHGRDCGADRDEIAGAQMPFQFDSVGHGHRHFGLDIEELLKLRPGVAAEPHADHGRGHQRDSDDGQRQAYPQAAHHARSPPKR